MAKGKVAKGGRKGKGNQRPKANYKVVQQSYEDKDYEDKPKPVLVPVAVLERRRRPKPLVRFTDEVPEDFTDRRNMLMDDDGLGEGIFGDEVEEDFDQDFIQQMMTGEGVEGEDEFDDEDLDDDELAEKRRASRHQAAAFRANERQFARMMKEFNMDEDIDEEDPRVQGPLQVEAYAAALEQFVEDTAGTSWMEEGGPIRHKGLLSQLRQMALENNIFDSNDGGLFYALLPDKGARVAKQFKEEHDALVELTKKQLEAGDIDTGDVLYKDQKEMEAEDGHDIIEVKVPVHERMDCETVLSTYSTLYNRPNVIAAETKKIQLKRPRPASKEELVEESSESEDGEDANPNLEALRYELSQRPKKETPEEKKARRQLVKQLQAERRQQKKALKGAYGEVATDEKKSRKMAQAARQTTQLSLVSAVAPKV